MSTQYEDHRNGKMRVALIGAAGAVLVLAGVIGGPSIDGPPITDAQAAADVYVDDAGAVLTSAMIVLLGAAALLWFAGVVRTWLAFRTDSGSPLPSVGFGGAIGGAVSLVFSGVIIASQALRAQDADAVVDPDVLASLDDLATHMFGLAAPICFSALVGAVAIAAIRRPTEVPRPFAMASVALAVLMIVPPVAWIGMLLFLVWLIVASSMVAFRTPPMTTVEREVQDAVAV